MSNGEPEDAEQTAVESLVEAGSEIAGGVGGTAVGLFVGGPGGAIAGAAAGPLVVRGLRRAAKEIRERFLSSREEVRIGGAFSYAAQEINQRLAEGASPRSDGFFEEEIAPGKSAADEILEGTLLAAQRSYEERKVPYLGKLYAGIAFDSEVTPDMGYHLVRLAEELTWTQYVLLAVFLRNSPGTNPWAFPETFLRPSGQTPTSQQIALELYDLQRRALVGQRSPQAPEGEAILSPVHLKPPFIVLQGMSVWFVQTAQLFSIPMAEQARIARMLGSAAAVEE